MENTSPKYSLNKTDILKISRGFLVTLAGTLLAYFAVVYTQIDWSFNAGGTIINLSPVLIPIFGAVIEAGRRFISNYENK